MTIEMKKDMIFQMSKRILLNRIENGFKLIYLIINILEERKKFSKKMKNILIGYRTRKLIKPYRLIQSFLNKRIESCNKIIDSFRIMLFRKKTKNLLYKLEDYHIIYSSINCKLLIFIVKYENGLEENLFFEYNEILKCNILFIHKSEHLCNKKLKGYFMTNSDFHLLDNNFPIEDNNNIIDIPNILKLYKELNFNYENIGKKFLSIHKKIYSPFRRKNRSHSVSGNIILKFPINQKFNSSSNLNIVCKPILKPKKSFLNFKEKKKIISFGSIEIMAA